MVRFGGALDFEKRPPDWVAQERKRISDDFLDLSLINSKLFKVKLGLILAPMS